MSKQRLLTIADVMAHLPDWWDESAREMVARAYELAAQAHAGQMRKSHVPYIQHPLAVAYLLADLRVDPDTVAAGLLHDVVEDTEVNLEQLRREFGEHVASLVDGVTKLEQIEEQIRHEKRTRIARSERTRSRQESESLRKMFLAMAHDVRVVIIKLADRLHNMRTLDPLPPERRQSIAQETLEIFAPLANRLGVWQWKWELEDLALRYTDNATYMEIASLIQERRQEREASIRRHIEVLSKRLEERGIQARITGRPKHIYSIYRKMQRKGVPFQQVYDVRGIRVITKTEPDCYSVLGIVHELWKPIHGEFDDYIASPKENKYQSLHTAVIGDDGNTLEVQIRTEEMHQVAEYGIAAHWRYKEGGQRYDEKFESNIAWLRSIIEMWQEVSDAEEFIDDVKEDLFVDRVYTFTPKGKLIDLPAGSTPIDFAYHIHTEVGHRCRGARVNGKLVRLTYKLQTGDRVEILTTKRGGPSRDWLNEDLGYVHTSRARSKIRQWFRRQDREQNIALGWEIVERELKRLGLQMSHEEVARLFGFDKLDDFYATVGFGDINSRQIAGRIAREQQQQEPSPTPESGPIPLRKPPQDVTDEIQVQGVGDMLTTLAGCCHPLPGDDIIGYITRGRGVTIHRRDCPNVLRFSDPRRLVDVNWGVRRKTTSMTVRVKAVDRPRLLGEISDIIGDENINIADVNIVRPKAGRNKEENYVFIYITLDISDLKQLSRVLAKLEQVHSVTEARRYHRVGRQ